jgi:DNA ligase-1
MSLYEIIKSLQQAQGNISKQAILDNNSGNFLLRKFIHATYDPGINYYIKKLPKPQSGSPSNIPFEELDIDYMVKALANRELTGVAAKGWLQCTVNNATPEARELFAIMLDHKIGASVGDTMVLKAWPDLYFLPPYQRCSLLDKKTREKFSTGKPFYVQTKLDGSFAYIVKWPDGRAEVITRQGSKYPQAFANMMAYGLKPGNVIVGELEVYERFHDEFQLLERKTGNGILNSVLKEGDGLSNTQSVRCTAWDLLTTEEFTANKSPREYSERLAGLKYEIEKLEAHQIDIVATWTVNTLEEAFAIYRDHTSRGLEGCVIKLPSSLWKDGTARDILKLKLKFQVEMRCVDVYEGEGKAAGMLGGIVIESEDKLLRCNCGSGFTDEQRKLYWADPSLIIEQVLTIEANDITQDRDIRKLPSLSLPIFVEVRTDKPEGADTYARIVYQHHCAKQGD